MRRTAARYAFMMAALVSASPLRAQCTDPCLSAAKSELRQCVSSVAGAFLDTVTGCLGLEHVCVDACRTERQDCRDATSLGPELVRCDAATDEELLECRATHVREPRRLAVCTGHARVAGFRCRRGATRSRRDELKSCRTGFGACTETCGPGGPPGGRTSCRADARAVQRAALDQCRVAYRATTSACIDRDLACVETCLESRVTCNAPARDALNALLADCTAARTAAIAACESANPDGGAGLDDCVRTALATAFACREAAIQTSAPSFGGCTATYVGCLHDCPAPGAAAAAPAAPRCRS